MKKPVRSASGISVVTVVTMPQPCPHGRCAYCPGGSTPTGPANSSPSCPEGGETPNSYTLVSPAIMRAKELAYDPRRQVEARLRALLAMGHPVSKIEVIVIGGTFLHFPSGYCGSFIKGIFDELNGCESKDLSEAQRINETAAQRCVALCIETRPDVCTDANIKELLRLGVTRVEIGVQALDDAIYERVNRGHTVADVVDATRRLKDAGFKVGYHMMPGLPGSTPEKDVAMFRRLFDDPAFRPDQLKIYPTQVIKGSLLEAWSNDGTFTPYPDDVMVGVLCDLKALVPPYCRIMRIQRQISVGILASGLWGDVRTAVGKRMKGQGRVCRCIRCKEIGFNKNATGPWSLNTLSYDASGGKEWFITMQNPDRVIQGIVRGRIGSDKDTFYVRELHVYGQQVRVDDAAGETGTTQHRGVGKRLMAAIEAIAKERGCKRIRVISGVGVRGYYAALGYVLDGPYMGKSL